MSLINCPECKKEISDSAKSCPLCGYEASSKKAESVFKKKLSKTELVFYLIVVILAGYWVISSELKDKKADKPTSPDRVVYNSPSGVSLIPADLKYEIHKDINNPRILKVILNQTVSENTLKVLGPMIRDAAKLGSREILIRYNLPNKRTTAWAVSDFGPDHKIQILGLTPEIEAKLIIIAQNHPGIRIGQWVGDYNVTTIYREGRSIFLADLYYDNSKGIHNVIEKQTREGRRFDYLKADARGNGEYHLINNAGELESRDRDGVFEIARNKESGRIWPLLNGQ
jgi:hypothetical protein